MSIVTIHEAKTNLSKLIQRALDGEEIIIAKRDQPLVKLTVVSEAKPVRRFGGCKGVVIEMGDSFDDELEDFAEYWPDKLDTSPERGAKS
jgi:prevent-host-death family protein